MSYPSARSVVSKLFRNSSDSDVPRFSDAAIQPIYRPFPDHVPLSEGSPITTYIVDESVTKVDSQENK